MAGAATPGVTGTTAASELRPAACSGTAFSATFSAVCLASESSAPVSVGPAPIQVPHPNRLAYDLVEDDYSLVAAHNSLPTIPAHPGEDCCRIFLPLSKYEGAVWDTQPAMVKACELSALT